MKKIFLFFALLIACTPAFAADAFRKISSDTISTPTVLSSTPATIYDVEIVASGSNGWVAIYDSASKASPQAGVKLVEVGEATSGNSKHVNLGPDGLKASKGITVWMSNATAIILYH